MALRVRDGIAALTSFIPPPVQLTASAGGAPSVWPSLVRGGRGRPQVSRRPGVLVSVALLFVGERADERPLPTVEVVNVVKVIRARGK